MITSISMSNLQNVKPHRNCEKRQVTANRKKLKVLYTVNECPPWYTCLALGFQHFLLMVISTMATPYILYPYMCMTETDHARAQIASTVVFVSGIVTLLQTTVGIRLPIVQGGSHTFTSAILAMWALMPCPSEKELLAMDPNERENVWKLRMNQAQGAFCIASLFQIFIGITGIVGILMKWITPAVIAATVSLVSLSLLPIAVEKAASNWSISSLTIFLLIVFAQYMGNIGIPICEYFGKKRRTFNVFKLFPVILACVLSWTVCFILTAINYIDKTDAARTDRNIHILHETPWFRIPYPGQWGWPVVTVPAVLGMITGVMASVIETIGDYMACATIAVAPQPPSHAINRGITIEGIGTAMSGLFGTGCGTTSYSENIGAITVTGVGSRRVVQYAAVFMILCGTIGKIGALIVNMPEPIIGGIFIFVFGMILSVGLSALQHVDMNASRNMFVIGFSIFVGLSIPTWLQKEENRNVINTSVPQVDQILSVLLRTPMFVGGILAFLLDNTIPNDSEADATPKKNKSADTKDSARDYDEETNTVGINGHLSFDTGNEYNNICFADDDDATDKAKRKRDAFPDDTNSIEDNTNYGRHDTTLNSAHETVQSCYDFPFGMKFIRQWNWTKRIPISPTFTGFANIRKRASSSRGNQERF